MAEGSGPLSQPDLNTEADYVDVMAWPLGEWWFWTAVGVVVVGGAATTTAIMLNNRDPNSVTIKAVW